MILDGHVHTYPDGRKPADVRNGLLKSMEEAGVAGGVILSPDYFAYPGMGANERMDYVLELCEGAALLFPFYFIDPLAENAVEEVEIAVKAGIKGFKLICTNYYPSDAGCMAVCKRAAELGKPVLFHSGILWDGRNSGKFNRPCEFECLIDIPELKFSLAHISWPWCDECLAVYGKFNNAYSVRPDLSCEMFIDITPGTPRNFREPVFSNILLGDYSVRYNWIFGTDCDANHYNVSWVKEWIARDNALYEKFVAEELADFKSHVYSKNLLRFLGESDEKVEKVIPQVAV